MSELYEKWAVELIDELFKVWADPFSSQYYDEAIQRLATLLREDVRDWLVPEEFCADCDYQRRYNQ